MTSNNSAGGTSSLEHLNKYLRNVPIAMALVTGDEYVYEVVNERYATALNFSREQLLGKPAFAVSPELKPQLKHILDSVRSTGISFQSEEFPIEKTDNGTVQRDYYTFSYEQFEDAGSGVNGVFITGNKVTGQVMRKMNVIERGDKFSMVADALPVLMSYIDNKERYVFNNKWYEEWFGRTSDQVKGKTLRDVLGETAYETIAHYVKRALLGERVSYEALVNYKHRGETWIHATYVPDRDNDGVVRGFYALVEDISNRKKIQDVVQKSDSYLRKLADSAPAIIWLTDATGYCFYLNREWYQLTGQSYEEALGFGWLKATHPDDAVSTEIAFRDATEFRMEYRAVFRLRTAIGEYRWVIDKGRPRFKPDGEFEGFIGTVVDIDKEMTAEQRIRESEEKYRDLFNTMEQGFCIVDVIFDERKNPVDYRFIEVNPVFEKQTGLAEATGRTARELIPALEQKWIDVYGRVASSGASVRFSQGSEAMGRWFDVYSFKVGARDSNLIAILFSDVSEKRKSEQQLADSEKKFRALVMATSDSIYQMNADWSVMKSLQGRGFTADVTEPASDWLDKLILPEDQPLVKEQIARAIQSKTFFELEHRILKADGSIGWTFSRAVPIFDNAGNTIEWFGAASDVTARNLATQSLRSSELRYKNLANDLEKIVQDRTLDLQRSNEDLERFAYVASHDLREPVRKVKTYIDRFRLDFGDVLAERAKEYLRRMDKASDRMNQMIEGVLRYSALNAVERMDTMVDIGALIDAVVYDLEVVITQKNAAVRREKLPLVRGSELLLYQLFYNLVNNSLKFSRDGIPPVIEIESSDANAADMRRINSFEGKKWKKVIVRDNGIGFNDNEASSIFETFTRLHSKDRYEGTGLGLALCQKIVAKHHGIIYAEGIEGEGATFTILLPE